MRRDRPKHCVTPRRYIVTTRDGYSVEIFARYRAEARHYSKSLVDRFQAVSSLRHYASIASCRLA